MECWSIVANALIEQKNTEKLKNTSQIKSFFSKRLSKSSELWYINFVDEYFDYKLSKSMNFNNQIKVYEYPSLNMLNVQHLVKKIEVMADFFCNNFQLIPISIDFREVNI